MTSNTINNMENIHLQSDVLVVSPAFNIGDVVEFGSAKRGYKVGTIDKIKIKKAIVVEDNGTRWNVPLQMLKVAA